MKIKSVELKNFKRFTHLIVEEIPESVKLVVLVGPNGSGKTSFMEAMNHYYKYSGYRDLGDYRYLSKETDQFQINSNEWHTMATKLVDIDFFDVVFPKCIGNSDIKGHFYFRSAYRNEPDFQIDAMHRQNDPTLSIRLPSLIQNDMTVSANYQRLISNTISGVFNSENDSKTVSDLRGELTGIISAAMERVFDDLKFSSLGEPLRNGSFFFSKGITENFHYRNLSAGEKAAFDLILDMVIQSRYYSDAVYCIDEPEIHMHTKLQGRVLRELFLLIPGNSQLWLSTHSIGMLQEAEEIEKENPGTVVFLDFGNRDYDNEQVIRPTRISRAVLEKFYELTLGDFAKLMLPKTIVFCEGDASGKSRKDYDKSIYTIIFGNEHPEAYFISGGSCSEIEHIDQNYGEIMTKLLAGTNVIKIVDRDDRSAQEVKELEDKGIKTLSGRHLETYLLDDSVIKKLCKVNHKEDKYEECMVRKKEAIDRIVAQGKPIDDIKSARGEIYLALKQILELTKCGNTADAFLRDTMAPLITSDMDIYKKLEKEVFG